MRSGRRLGARRWGSVGTGLGLLVLLAVAAALAPWLAPYDPEEQLDPAESASRPPLAVLERIELTDGSVLVAEAATTQGDALSITRRSPADSSLRAQAIQVEADRYLIPLSLVGRIGARRHWLGTDRLGRDLLSRLLFGARTSLAVGTAAAALALALGLLVGAAAAMGPALLDELLMRIVDGLLAFPPLLLVLALALFFEPRVWTLVLIIGGTAWMGLSRLVRSELLTVLHRPYVLAARSLGAGPLRLLVHHMLPNAWPTIAVAACLLVGDAILVESAVAFLGLGVASELPSWGRMVEHARGDMVELWWMSTVPGVCIVLAVLSFNLIGDGLRDAFDPRLRSAVPAAGHAAGAGSPARKHAGDGSAG